MVLLEAMCVGQPVIASQIKGSGISFVVQHGKTGFLVPPGDPECLSAALSVMANSPNLLTEMGGAAASRFNRHFRIEGVARQTLNHYRCVCAQETNRASQRKGRCYPY
jgi:rhamnosyl/mannosyltransferase